MDLQARIQNDMVAAMKEKDALRLSTLRMAKSAIKNREIEAMKKLEDVDVIKVLAGLVKQRKDSAEQYLQGNRTDLASKETEEIKILETYLPAALSREAIEEIVGHVIAELGASSPKDMGAVMKTTIGRLAGQSADGKLVSEIVKSRLSG